MIFVKSNNEYNKIKSSFIKNCNVIYIDENDFPDQDHIIDIISLDYKNPKMYLLSANLNGKKRVSKMIVSIVSNIDLALHEVNNILINIKLQFEHSEIILGIGKNNDINGIIVTTILIGENKHYRNL